MRAVSWASQSYLPFGIRHAHTVTRDVHTGPTRGAPAWVMGLPTMLGQCHMPPLPPGSAAIAPTGYAHARATALGWPIYANPSKGYMPITRTAVGRADVCFRRRAPRARPWSPVSGRALGLACLFLQQRVP